MNIIKKTISHTLASIAFLSVLIFSTSLAYADDHSEEGKGKEGKRFEKLAQKLKLSDTQKTQLKPLLKQQQQERKAALESVKAKHQEELAKILNKEQLEQLKTMKQGKKKKMLKKFGEKKEKMLK